MRNDEQVFGNPGPEHVKCMKHIPMYLACHPDLGITHHGPEEVLKNGYDHKDNKCGGGG